MTVNKPPVDMRGCTQAGFLILVVRLGCYAVVLTADFVINEMLFIVRFLIGIDMINLLVVPQKRSVLNHFPSKSVIQCFSNVRICWKLNIFWFWTIGQTKHSILKISCWL